MARGPVVNLSDLFYASHDIGFRVITDYHVQTDGHILRLDAKIENRQYCVALLASNPSGPHIGEKIKPDDDMIKPKVGHELECINKKVTKSELVKALRELANDIETDKKDE